MSNIPSIHPFSTTYTCVFPPVKHMSTIRHPGVFYWGKNSIHITSVNVLVSLSHSQSQTRSKAEAFTQAFLKNSIQQHARHDLKSMLSHKAVILGYARPKKEKKRNSKKAKGLNARQKRAMKIFHIKPEHQRLVRKLKDGTVIVPHEKSVGFYCELSNIEHESQNNNSIISIFLSNSFGYISSHPICFVAPLVSQHHCLSHYHCRYELFLPLHDLWRHYIIDLCSGLKPTW